MPQPKINIVYIASIGRSGTTLFESILGAHPDMETVGEVHIWPHELALGGFQPCGSGEYIYDDPFWEEMRQRVNPFKQPAPQIHHFREFHNHGFTLRPKHLRDIASRPVPHSVQTQIHQYGLNNYEMFHTFADLVEETTMKRPLWLVDASKDPYRLAWLIRSGFFNIKVIHMVKNPPGFIYSVTKEWTKTDGENGSDPLRGLKRLYYTSRQSVAWVIQNQLFSRVIENHVPHSDHMLIQYEELARKPYETVRAACDLIGVRYVQDAVDNFRDGSPFTIAGNPMRYRSGGIRLDEKWKRRLPASSRRIASLLTRPIRARYGY